MFKKLRTTAPGDFDKALDEIKAGKRSFLWFTINSTQQENAFRLRCVRANLTISCCMPVWFILAWSRKVSQDHQIRMTESILKGTGLEDARWRGEMFGYPAEDIDWYVQEVEDAWRRFRAWKGAF